jgi:hypothetical protein
VFNGAEVYKRRGQNNSTIADREDCDNRREYADKGIQQTGDLKAKDEVAHLVFLIILIVC